MHMTVLAVPLSQGYVVVQQQKVHNLEEEFNLKKSFEVLN